jgi:serine/threonine protein kinase
MYQMLLGMYAIHSANVLHRDLKPSNVLLSTDMDVRICDFGLARGLDLNEKDDPHMSTFYVVTRWYRSPELCMSYEESYKALDMWSIGCMFGELLQKPKRRPLFPGKDTLTQLKLILDVHGQQTDDDIKGVPNAKAFVKKAATKEKKPWNKIPYLKHVTDENTLSLLDGLLAFNPEKRMTVGEALKHPYFKEIYDEEDLKTYPKVDFIFDEKSAAKDKDYCKSILFFVLIFKEMIYNLIMGLNKQHGIAGE